MAFHLQGAAIVRKSEIGSLVESFIDENNQTFSMEQIELLESLAKEVDEAATELENELEENQNGNS